MENQKIAQKQPCFGTLKPISGSCRNCGDYQACLDKSMGISIALSEKGSNWDRI
jgi:hypothetical protein